MQTFTFSRIAAGNPLQRLMKQHGEELTSQEKQILSLSDEDLEGLGISESYEMLFQSIDMVLRKAYNKNPQFRAMMGREPKEATKLVSKLIQYAEGESGIMVHHDPDKTARQLLEAIYKEKSNQTMSEGKKPEEVSTGVPVKIQMTPDVIRLFGISETEYTADISREKISEAINNFVVQMDPMKVSPEDATEYIYSFLKGIKQKKQNTNELMGKPGFEESDKRLFSGTDADLKKKSRDLYLDKTKVISKGKADSPTQIDSWIRDLIMRVRNLTTDIKDTIEDTLHQMELQKQQALPNKDELNSKLEAVNAALSSAGITEKEFSLLVDIDYDSMNNDPLFNSADSTIKQYDKNTVRIQELKNLISKGEVGPISKQAAEEDEPEPIKGKKVSDKDMLKADLYSLEREQEKLAPKVEVLKALIAKKDKVDVALEKIDNYLDFLNQYKRNITDTFSTSAETFQWSPRTRGEALDDLKAGKIKKPDKAPRTESVFANLAALGERFSAIKSSLNELSQQAEFKRLWEGKDIFFGKPDTGEKIPEAAPGSTEKLAAFGAPTKEKDEDAIEAVDELINFLNPKEEDKDDPEKNVLGVLEQKLLSMRDPKNYKAPDVSITQIIKSFDNILKLYNKFSPKKLSSAYLKKIKDLIDVKKFYFKSVGKDESKKRTQEKKLKEKEEKKRLREEAKKTKKYSFSDLLRKQASRLVEAFKPSLEMKKPDWMVFSNKFKRAGKDVAKKSFINFFDKPTVLNRFLHEIGKQGFNFIDIVGGKENLTYPDPKSAEAKINNVFATVLKDFNTNLEKHIINEAGQKRATEDGIEKARESIKADNELAKKAADDVSEIKKYFLPKMDKFAAFLNDPVKYLIRRSPEDPDSFKILDEMDLTPEERRDVKSEMHEEKSGRKTLMDKMWYKKNMIKLFNHYVKGNPLSDNLPSGQPVVLDAKEQKRRLQELREAKDAETRVNFIIDNIEKAHKDRAFLTNLLKGPKESMNVSGYVGRLISLSNSINTDTKNVYQLLELHKGTLEDLEDYIDKNKGQFGEEQITQNISAQEKIRNLINNRINELDVSRKQGEELTKTISELEKSIESVSKDLDAFTKQMKEEHRSGKVRTELSALQRNYDSIEKRVTETEAAGKPVDPKDKKDLETIKARMTTLTQQPQMAPADIQKLDMLNESMLEAEKEIKNPRFKETLKKERFLPPSTGPAPSEAELAKLKEEYWANKKDFTKLEEDKHEKTAAMEDSWGAGPQSTHDIITQTVPEDFANRGKKFPTKVKDWDVFEHLLGKDIDRLAAFKDVLEKEGSLDPALIKEIYKQIAHLSSKIAQKTQRVRTPIDIAGETVKIGDVGKQFNALFDEYQNKLNKAIYQKRDALKRVNDKRNDLMSYDEYINPDTGEFKPMTEQEKKKIIGFYMEQLYKELDEKWSTTVGSQNLFGERQKPNYNVVFETFKNLGAVRSNRSVMSQIGDINKALRAQFQEYPKYRNRIQEIDAEMAEIADQYKEMGQDPTRFLQPRVKEREMLMSKAADKELLFRRMLDAITKEERANILEGIFQVAKDKGTLDADSEKEMTTNVEELREDAKKDVAEIAPVLELPVKGEVEKEIPDTVMAQILNNALNVKSKEKAKKEEKKEAYDYTKDINFNSKLLYGSVMQKTILGMALNGQ